MPALEALLDRFYAANTQPLGLSVDSAPCHANWGASLGGVSFPLLSDFHPKGGVADSFGLYQHDYGTTARATVIIDAGGVVRFAKAVKSGRDMAELAAACEAVDAAYDGELPACPSAAGVGDDAVLFVKNNCGFSRAVLLARDNLHLGGLPTRNVSEDDGAMAELRERSGAEQAPCMVAPGEVLLESKEIIRRLADAAAPL